MAGELQGEAPLVVCWENPPAGSAASRWEFSSRDTQQFYIGRSPDVEIQINDPTLSRLHAIVTFELGVWVFHARGRNPCTCAGEPIRDPLVLHDGMSVHLATGRFPAGQAAAGQATSEPAGDETRVGQVSTGGPCLRFETTKPAPEPGDDEDRKQQVTLLIQDLAGGDDNAATHLWELYFRRVAQAAKLRLSPALRRVTDEEDVAASVFESLFDGVSQGKFAELASRDNLWRLLSVMTTRKAADHAQHQLRAKRGGGDVRGESIFLDDEGTSGIAQFVAITCDPHFEAQFTEEIAVRLEALGDDTLRRVAQLKLEGYTNDEIAEQLECTGRTVQRKLQEVRAIWSEGESETE